MGTCLSKKSSSSPSPPQLAAKQAPATTKQTGSARIPDSPARKKTPPLQPKQEASETEEESFVKKEVFIIKHRKSHDRQTNGHVSISSPPDSQEKSTILVDGSSKDGSEATGNNVGASAAALAMGSGIRTSSCTKEEVESILIQCGRLSHSGSSCPASGGRSRRYSGSKRSYDFDHSTENDGSAPATDADEARQHRQLSRPSPSRGSRRRTPSRERDQRSGSTERRRVSRSPGRRSEMSSAPAAPSENPNKPGKLVSVPATVPAAEPPAASATAVRRITVRRNVGEGGRSAASPRSQSPARGGKEGTQAAPPVTISRNSSRKAEQSPHRRNLSIDADPLRKTEQSPYRRNPNLNDTDPSRKTEQSPYRRNPLSEIDHNSSSAAVPLSGKVAQPISGRAQNLKNKENEGLESLNMAKVTVLKANVDPSNRKATHGTLSKVSNNSKETEKLEVGEEENQKPPRLTRSRSARRSSGHIEFNPDTQPNHPSSYTNLLLEDIQNFHQTNPSSISLPACVTKAHSIFQAVADLNNNSALSDDKRAQPQTLPSYQFSSNCLKDPFEESEVGAGDVDLMEPSIHKYVTTKRGGSSNTNTALSAGDREELESSGSNSFIGVSGGGSIQNRREPGSADSSDCWTSSSVSRNHVPEVEDSRRKMMSGKRRDRALEQRVRCR